MKIDAIVRVSAVLCASLIPLAGVRASNNRLPDGTEVQSWEKPLSFSKTYYVDGKAANADDNGPGTRERPFRTVNKAAQVLQPGERAVIAEGVYREWVNPPRGGTGPEMMISYEAAPGSKVVIKGSAVLDKGWKPSDRGAGRGGALSSGRAWQIDIGPFLRGAYNPFAMVNVPGDRFWMNYKVISMTPYFRRRGMIFVDGKPLEQMDSYNELFALSPRSANNYEDIQWHPLFEEIGGAGGKFWVDLRGTTLYVRLPNDDPPEKHVIEATVQEQVFASAERGLGYIRVKGISFQHGADPFPMPQSGMVATNGGNHWIIEDNTFEWANAICLAVGNGLGGGPAPAQPQPGGSHMVRKNTIRYCGIGGIEGLPSGRFGVIEKNLIEWVGWQDAEREWEAGGIKLHTSRDGLLRNNVILHMRHAAGLWLDVAAANNRVTGNVIADVVSVSGAIHIEGTHEQHQVDNNVIWGVKNSEPGGTGLEGSAGSGIFIQGTDKLIVAQNLIGNVQSAGVYSVPVEKRLIGTRGGTARENKVYNNIFYGWGTAAIGFANEHNQSDGNVYVMAAGRGGGGYLRILNPEPQQWLDVLAFREFYGLEKNGAVGAVEELTFDIDKLMLTLLPRGDWPKVALFNSIDTDLFGAPAGETRWPGPFANLAKGFKQRAVDPRAR